MSSHQALHQGPAEGEAMTANLRVKATKTGGKFTLPSGATVTLWPGDTGYVWRFTRPKRGGGVKTTNLALSYEAMAALILLADRERENIMQAIASTELMA
jgi:hypothetical protein